MFKIFCIDVILFIAETPTAWWERVIRDVFVSYSKWKFYVQDNQLVKHPHCTAIAMMREAKLW